MKKVGDYVVYRKDVCRISEILEKYMKDMDYYRLVPIDDESLQVVVPIDLNNNLLRDLISKEEVESLINKMPELKPIECNEKLLEAEYKNLINSDSLEDYVRIIKTTYLRNKKRLDNKKKISDKDNRYFELAEKYLCNEFSVVLGKTYEETKQYIIDKVSSIVS